ncbi:hypothetical protein HY572_00420 [Candidatus Micrarchaeota archaeon]|nr:hypothetical protein [Candidatus Micrarchaeota archaeon]
MKNLIREIENLHRYGDIQQIHWNQAHATQSVSGALQVKIPVTLHPFKGGVEGINEKLTLLQTETQLVVVGEEYDEPNTRRQYIQLHQPLALHESNEILELLRAKGLVRITRQNAGTYSSTPKSKPKPTEFKPGKVSDN